MKLEFLQFKRIILLQKNWYLMIFCEYFWGSIIWRKMALFSIFKLVLNFCRKVALTIVYLEIIKRKFFEIILEN